MDLDRRLEDIGWALFLIMIGVLWLVPDEMVPRGTWIIGTGLIMVGINVVRYAKNIPVNRFSATLGIVALIAGTASIAGIGLQLFPILLVVIGAMLLARPLFTRTA